jgi:hypothetical protein
MTVSAGYALFKAKDKKLLKDGDKDLNSVQGAVNALKLKKFTVSCHIIPDASSASNGELEIRECCHGPERSCCALREQGYAHALQPIGRAQG